MDERTEESSPITSNGSQSLSSIKNVHNDTHQCKVFPPSKEPIKFLERYYHEPKYALPIPTNPKYANCSLEEKSQLLYDYFTKMHSLQMKQYRKSSVKATNPQPIKLSIANDPSSSVIGLAEDEDIYVTKHGRATHKIDYRTQNVLNMVENSNGNDVVLINPTSKVPSTHKNELTCPICNKRFKRNEIEGHAERCTSAPADYVLKETNNNSIEIISEDVSKQPKNPPNIALSDTDEETVDECEKPFERIRIEPPQLNNKRKRALNNLASSRAIKPKPTGIFKVKPPAKKVCCPICNKKLAADNIQKHMDVCLAKEETGKNLPEAKQNQSEQQYEKTFEMNNGLPQYSSTPKPKSTIETVSCPICNIKIEADQIEIHVEFCLAQKNEEEDILEVLPGPENTSLLTCEVCDRHFSAKDYEFHVMECINRPL